MKINNFSDGSRRQFITKVIPGCAFLCLAGSGLPLLGMQDKAMAQEVKHKFESEFERKLTHKQFYRVRYGEYIQLAKLFVDKFGQDNVIELIKENTQKRMLKYGENHAKRSPDNTFATYINTFKNPNAYKVSLTKEVVEDTEKAFELKITECIWASAFLDFKAGDIGYATVCWGDYAWAEGFNPKISLVRDKTLMQDHDCCNHRYIWKE